MTTPIRNEGELEALPSTIYSWVEDVTKAQVTDAVRLPGGNRREAWLLHLEQVDHSKRTVFLRHDPVDPATVGEYYTIRREAEIYRAVNLAGLKAPTLIAMHPTQEISLLEAISGDTELKKVSDLSVRSSIMSEFISELAKLHCLDLADLSLGNLGSIKSLREQVLGDLAIWEQLYRYVEPTDPLIEFSLSWLARNVPAAEAPVVLVHGDAGPGNFLYSDGHLSSFIDWELSHLGDPMEDLAWLSLRSVFEPLPEWATCLHQYADLVGRPIDYGRLRYHRVFVQLRVAIIRHRQNGNSTPSGDVANGLLSFAVNRRLLLEALMDAMGIQRPEVSEQSVARVTQRTWLYDAALAILRDSVVARSNDPIVTVKAKSAVRIVKYLRELDMRGSDCEEEERIEIASILDEPEITLSHGRERLGHAIRKRDIPDEVILAYLEHVVMRDASLMASASGALRDRHHPGLVAGGES